MFALLAVKATLRLFSPLLIGATLAMFVFVLGRRVASRKFTHALDDDDPTPEPEVDAPGANHPRVPHLARDARVASESVTSQPREADSSSIARHSTAEVDVAAVLDRVPTREFVRARDSKRRSVDIVDEETVRYKRPDLDSGAVAGC